MRILGFDTGGDLCAVILADGGKLIDKRCVETQRDQAEVLAPMTQELLQAHNLATQDIDCFAIASGPGSFTGLRVGLAFARGLQLATHNPTIGFDHFRCTWQALVTKTPTLIIRESKRDELFACLHDANGKPDAPFLATPQELVSKLPANVALAGNGAFHLAEIDPALSTRILPLELHACALAAAQLAEKTSRDLWPAAQPVYLRDADVNLAAIR